MNRKGISSQTIFTEGSAVDWQSLINEARNGCDESLGRIAKQVHGYLLTIASKGLAFKLRPKFSASDVVQISMIEARKDIENFRGSTQAEIKTWLRRIVIHNLTDEAKRFTCTGSREISREVPIGNDFAARASSQTPSRVLSTRESNAQLLHAVNELPPRQRYVVTARFREGLGYSEIAGNLGISEPAARQLWIRAAEKLRTLVGQFE